MRDAADRAALRVTRVSAIARALRALPDGAAELATRRRLALLAVLEAEPADLLRDEMQAVALVDAVAERTRPATLEPVRTAEPAGAAAARTAPRAGSPQRGDRTTKIDTGSAPSTISAGRADAVTAAGTETPSDAAPERPIPDLAVRAHTEWGGLLFLLHVVRELELPARALADDRLRARSLRWTLHRLAVRLLDLDERDPAAAAFAGLLPDGDAPWRGDPPPSEEEDAAVDEHAGRLAARVLERLERAPSLDPRIARAAVRACARRGAELVCEPGWIDAQLRLDEVVVETRRAGLDLDPGWIGWLGVVVRIVYV